ncbi:MAG: hypothetical protein H6559_21500 [Lewinellaceae bacterium]|nr:hypothetical protein [Lewinellaceae bacterium]
MALGTACCLYILLFVREHRGYDRHHRQAENLYRIVSDLQFGNEIFTPDDSTCSPPIAPVPCRRSSLKQKWLPGCATRPASSSTC